MRGPGPAMPATQDPLAAAFELHKNGDLAAAERAYRAVVKAQPANPDALYLLGMLCLDRNAERDAVRYLQRAISAAAKVGRQVDPGWYLALGSARQRQGDHEGALAEFDAALRRHPGSIDALFCRATALADLGRVAAARETYERLLAGQPNHIEALNNLGVIHRETGSPAAAVKAFRRAVRLNPRYVDALCNLGRALADGGSAKDALPILRAAADRRPHDGDLHEALFDCLLIESLVDEVSDRARRFLERHPDRAPVVAILGTALQYQGRADEALEMFRRALRLDPACSRAHQGLTQGSSEAGRDEHMTTIREALDSDRPGPSERAGLWFAMAEHHAARGEHVEAFDACAEGNAIKHALFAERGYGYDSGRMAHQVDVIRRAYDADCLTRPAARSTARPVFIVGMPRSGTTLVEQILASHPLVHGADELTTIYDTVSVLEKRVANGAAYPDMVVQLDAAAIEWGAKRYLEKLDSIDTEAARVTDKMPTNFFHLGMIAVMLPRARVIHCRRDAMDVCLSNFVQLFAEGHYYSYDLSDIAAYYRGYERIMSHWREVLPIRMYEVQYEELINDQERISRELLDYIGLDWDDRCLAFYETKRAVRTASNWQVRQPIYKSAQKRWKNYEKNLTQLKSDLQYEELG